MSGGVGEAIKAAMEAEGDMASVVQAGLFDDLDASETGSLSAASPLSAALGSAKRSRGRPKHSKNRRTEAVVAWLLQDHRHPLAVIMEAYSMSPGDFAKAIGIMDPDSDTLLDIVKLQLRMAEAALPYIAQKMPMAVQVDGVQPLSIQFAGVVLGGNGGVSDPARGPAAEISVGAGMHVQLGQVGQVKSDGDLSS